MSKEAMKLALETAEGIVNADWRKWDELASPAEFERWAKSRAYFMATILRQALAEQPAQQEPGRNHWEDGDVFERIAASKPRPQAREPLTDEQIVAKALHLSGLGTSPDVIQFARAIEAAHGIKGDA